MLGILRGKSKGKEPDVGPPVDIKWKRNANGKFHNLMILDTSTEGLDGASGIYTIWKGGTRSEWLYAGSTRDLGQALEHYIDDPEMEDQSRSGVYVSWARVKPEFQDGIVRYLNEVMKPQIENPEFETLNEDKVPMIAVFLPGKEK